jgi:hypothetical protein
MTEAPQVCPCCGHTNEHWDQFCLSCGRRVTSVVHEGLLHRLLRKLSILKPSDALGENPTGVGEAYRHTPMNHSDGGR